MKLSTLLLSSAAVLVAGSAFAADLPSKKAAPAAAVTVCKVGDVAGFTIPGSDNCINIGGWVRYSGSYSSDNDTNTTAKYSQGGNYRINIGVRSNSEFGVINGYLRFQGDSDLKKAYVQIGGLTVGKIGSLADIAGTNAENYGSDLGGGTGDGIQYALSAGAATVKLGLENAANNNASSYVTDRPDVLLSLGAKAGPADITIVGASHEALGGASATSKQGYAVVGKAGVSLGGPVSFALFGGYSTAALKYTGVVNSIVDTDGTDSAKGTNIGGELKFDAGVGTLAIAADRASAELGTGTKVTRDNVGVSFVYTGIKGISIEPEYIYSKTDLTGSKSSSTAYLRIQRDF